MMDKSRLFFLALFFLYLEIPLLAAQPNLKVEGIFCEDQGKCQALVNGEIVKVGSKIDGAKIIEISKDSVRFKYGNEFVTEKITGGSSQKYDKSSDLEQYKSRMNKAEATYRDVAKEHRVLTNQKKIQEYADDITKQEQYLEYADRSDDYYEAAIRYESMKKYKEAADALQNSISYAERALSMPMDDAARANLNSIIEYRKNKLDLMRRKSSPYSYTGW